MSDAELTYSRGHKQRPSAMAVED
ncbi:uncharacterized protein METZ01_LOCUS129577 [marine metagenome]|uniref:Uncharacterized protein n=1 Tax=marine metagenome TaxID=408172 RepID=A0A381YJN9_9ZZZZ